MGPRNLELELIQPHMIQKSMLRGEVGARALRVLSRSVSGWTAKRGRRNALGSWVWAWVSVAAKGRWGVISFLFVVQHCGIKVQGTADSG